MSSFTRSLVLEDTGDGRHWSLFAAIRYEIGKEGSGHYVDIPAGFITDLASVPRVLHSLVPPTGRGNASSVLHDYLYQHPYFYYRLPGSRVANLSMLDRLACDQIFYEALRVQGAGWLRAQAMYRGVRIGGWRPWRRYRERKLEQGLSV